MTRDMTSVVLIALLAILLAVLFTGGPMMGWGMMSGTYLVNPVAAILTFLLCTLVIWFVRGPTSGQQPKS
jgi:uncharacterized membrane protein